MRYLGERGDAPPALTNSSPRADAAVAKAIRLARPTIRFRGSVYASVHVRRRLETLHRGKCAFCEVVIRPVSTPHVEHFRPKGGVINETTGGLSARGYYWLAYSWTNLLLACPSCNGAMYKGNRFPLSIEANRARIPSDDIDLEDPVFIDPFVEDPRDFIRFRGPAAYAVGDNPRGDATITVLGLNREDLVGAREECLADFFDLVKGAAELPNGAAKTGLERIIGRMMSDQGSYSSCILDAVENLGL